MILDIFNSYGRNAKSMAIALRNKDLQKQLILETNYLPDGTGLSERLYLLVNGMKEIPVCPVCGKPRRFRKFSVGYFATCGDEACKSAMIAKANRGSKRDWDAIQKKMKATYAERHNDYEHNMQDPEFRKVFYEKYEREHNGEKCGVCSEKAKINREKVFEERGGLRQIFEQGIIDKFGSLSECAAINNKKRANIKSEKDLEEIKKRLDEMGYDYLSEENHIVRAKCRRCGNEFEISRLGINRRYCSGEFNFCNKCDYLELTYRSHFEKEISEEIRKFYDGEILMNKKILGRECDIVIPEKMIAIEANGCYWHTIEYKEKRAHQEKKIVVEGEGYNLIQIWEDDWKDPVKKEIILSRLKSKLGLCKKIYARKCSVMDISGKMSYRFLNENHIQGNISATYKFGLFYNGELVEVMTFGKARKMISGKSEAIELYRLCTKKGINVVGGFSKLFKYAINNMRCSEIISFADCDWCRLEGNGYERVGFEKVKITDPGYCYYVGGKRMGRMNFTKAKLVKMGKDPNKSEEEIMREDKHYRIYDSGNILFKYRNEDK